MYGADDLAAVDALKIDARNAEVGVLDMRVIWQRDPLAQQLDGVGVAELVVVPTSAQAPLSRHDR